MDVSAFINFVSKEIVTFQSHILLYKYEAREWQLSGRNLRMISIVKDWS